MPKTVATSMLQEIKEYTNEYDFYEKKSYIGDLFYKNVGIVRREEELLLVQSEIANIKENITKYGVSDASEVYNTNRVEFLEFLNLLDVAESVVAGALARKSSCGAHYMAGEDDAS